MFIFTGEFSSLTNIKVITGLKPKITFLIFNHSFIQIYWCKTCVRAVLSSNIQQSATDHGYNKGRKCGKK